MNYEENSLSIIKKSHILSVDDLDIINSLKNELQDTFLNVQIFRTKTEMETSILNDLKFPTPDSKYWQSVREQNVMFNELVMLSYEYRKNQVEIRQLQRKLESIEDGLEYELVQIEIEKKQFIGLQQERTAKDRIREINEWHEIKELLKINMECSLTDVNQHQLISYTKRWINQFIAMGTNGSPSEKANLIGQLDKGIKMCKQKKCIDKILESFDKETITLLEKIGIGII